LMTWEAAAGTGRRVKLVPAAKPGWFEISDLPSDNFVKLLEQLPGVLPPSGKVKRPLVHRNLVLARQDIFEPQTIPTRYEGPVPTQVGAKRLADYQLDGIRFLLARPGALLADDVGVGKTLQALTTVVVEGHQKVLIIGPLISQGAWCSPTGDPKVAFGLDVAPLTGRLTAPPTNLSSLSWAFIHFDVLKDWMPFLMTAFRPTAVILDEISDLRGRKTQRASKVRSFMRLASITRRIGLSATPISNEVGEFWSILDCLVPDGFGPAFPFGVRYEGLMKGEFGWEPTGETNVEEFRVRLSDIMLRRTRGEVLKSMPPLRRHIVDVQLSGTARARYDEIDHDVRQAFVDVRAGAERIVQITHLRKELALAKVPATCAAIQERWLETHKKIVLFTWFKSAAAAFVEALTPNTGIKVLGPVSGDVPLAERVSLAQEMAAHDGKAVYVATLASCEKSLNDLVAASCTIFNDLHWVPDKLLQAGGRVHRQGQVRDVDEVFMRALGTLDDLMIAAIMRKTGTIEVTGVGGEGINQIGDMARALAHTDQGTSIDPIQSLLQDLAVSPGFDLLGDD